MGTSTAMVTPGPAVAAAPEFAPGGGAGFFVAVCGREEARHPEGRVGAWARTEFSASGEPRGGRQKRRAKLRKA